MHIHAPRIYPLKSTRGLQLGHAEVQARGLANDRRWMVVDAVGRFVTARKFASMLLIDAMVDAGDGALVLDAPGRPTLRVVTPALHHPTVDVQVWQSQCSARVADDEANRWISTVLDGDYRLVHMAEDCLRSVSQTWAQAGDIVSFADGFPLLLIGTASLGDLNRRLQKPVTMAHFRPNLVVETTEPFIEDEWKRVRIGALEFDVSKPCTRCVLTTVDPASGVRDEDGEPLATLKTFRRFEIGVTFGQNLIPRGLGVLRVGDPLVPLS